MAVVHLPQRARRQPQGRAQLNRSTSIGASVTALIIAGQPEVLTGIMPTTSGGFSLAAGPAGKAYQGPATQIPGYVWYDFTSRPIALNGDMTAVLYASATNAAQGLNTHMSDNSGSISGPNFQIGNASAVGSIDGNPTNSLSGDFTKPTLFTVRRIGNQAYFTAGKQKATGAITGTRTGAITGFTFGRDHSGSNNGSTTASYMLAIIPRALSDAEIDMLVDNPWLLAEAQALRVAGGAAGGGTITLTGAASTQDNGSGIGAISQVHALIAAASAQANTSLAAAVSQVHALIGSGATQANDSSAAAVTQVHALVGIGSTQANTCSTGVETQIHILAGSTASQSNTSANGVVSQVHQLTGAGSTQANDSGTGAIALGGQLVGAPSAQVNVSASLAITQVHQLTGSGSTQGNLSGTGAVSIQTDPRYARPKSDVAAGGWTPSSGTDLYAMLDEAVADPSDYISSENVGDICRLKLGPVADPDTSSGQVMRYQVWDGAGTGGGVKVRLYCGGSATIGSGTLISAWSHASLPTVPTIFPQTLTAAECDAITDYTNLFLELESQ